MYRKMCSQPVEVIVSADGDPDTPVTILTDEVALTSILRNLLSNGIKYTDHGEVRLSARVAGPRLEISVADTGIGIPAGLHEHVFEELAPLLVAGPDAAYAGEGGLLLGVPMHEPNVEMALLPPGGTLLLMTDGLVEERRVFLDVNLEKLRVAAQEASGADVEAFSNQVMSIFGPREDDVAMVAVRRT